MTVLTTVRFLFCLFEPVLAVVQPHSGAKYFSRLAHTDTVTADFSGKEIEVTIQTVESSREFEDNYVDLSKVINMEIDEEE